MKEQIATLTELAGLLNSHREELAAAWMESMLKDAPDILVCSLPQDKFAEDALLLVDAITQTITHDRVAEDTWPLPGSLSIDRWIDGDFDMADITSVLMLFKKSALPILWRSHPDYPYTVREEFTDQLDHYLWRQAHFSIKYFVAEATRRLAKQKHRTDLMLEAARTAGSSLHLDDILTITGKGICDAIAVRGCMFCLMEEAAELNSRHIYTSSGDRAARDVMQLQLGTCKNLNPNLQTIIDRVRKEMKPETCTCLQTMSQFDKSEFAPEIKSFLVLPCTYEGGLEAIAIACAFDDAHTFLDDEIELAWGISSAVAPAIVTARLHKKLHSLAVSEERVRLAQEMHDSLAQVLGTLSLKADVAGDLLAEGDSEKVQTTLHEMKHITDDAFDRVREEIFGLRAYNCMSSKLLPALQEYLENYRLYFDLNTYLTVEDESILDLPDFTCVQIFRIIQEALANVKKHGRTRDAWVSISKVNDGVRIEIRDDGVGFDLMDIMRGRGLSYGLGIMRERAESVGGHLSLHTKPGEATRVEVWVPSAEGGGTS